MFVDYFVDIFLFYLKLTDVFRSNAYCCQTSAFYDHTPLFFKAYCPVTAALPFLCV